MDQGIAELVRPEVGTAHGRDRMVVVEISQRRARSLQAAGATLTALALLTFLLSPPVMEAYYEDLLALPADAALVSLSLAQTGGVLLAVVGLLLLSLGLGQARGLRDAGHRS